MRLAVAAVALALAASPADYVASHQQSDGGFAEPGGTLRSRADGLGRPRAHRRRAETRALGRGVPEGEARLRRDGHRAAHPRACDALGRNSTAEVTRLEGIRRPRRRIGPLVNSTIWGVIALRATERPPGRASAISSGPSTERRLVVVSARRPGLERHGRGDPGAAGGRCRSPRQVDPPGARLLRKLQRPDGGFALGPGRAADAQSTAWAIQAFVTAGRAPGPEAFRYLAQLRRPDGSYRYSKRYAATPVWVTSQVCLRSPGARSRFVSTLSPWRAESRLRSSRSATSSSPGDTINTNAAWLAQQLEELGVTVTLMASLPDEIDRIADFVRDGVARRRLRHRHRRARRHP